MWKAFAVFMQLLSNTFVSMPMFNANLGKHLCKLGYLDPNSFRYWTQNSHFYTDMPSGWINAILKDPISRRLDISVEL